MLTAAVERWREQGAFEAVAGRRLFVLRRGGSGPRVVLLHGFPSSSFDFAPLLDERPDWDVLTFDFLGFGLSDKPRGHVYSLSWQADAVEELVRRGGPGPVVIVAHDMGTSVATELLARDLRGALTIDVRAVLLFNGSILLDRASPTIGQKLLRSRAGGVFARLTSEASFRAQFGRVFAPAQPLTRADAADHWSLISNHDGHRIGHKLIHYMDERDRLTDRWHGAVRDWPGDLSLAWGLLDPVATTAVLDGLRELRPGVPVTELPELGHYPQLEAPSRIADVVDVVRARVAALPGR